MTDQCGATGGQHAEVGERVDLHVRGASSATSAARAPAASTQGSGMCASGLRPEPEQQGTAVAHQPFAAAGESDPHTSVAPQLAAAGLGIATGPVSAVSAGFPGVVRSFSPRWTRQLFAVTPGEPDPLAARFVADLRTRGVWVPRDVKNQLEFQGVSFRPPCSLRRTALAGRTWRHMTQWW